MRQAPLIALLVGCSRVATPTATANPSTTANAIAAVGAVPNATPTPPATATTDEPTSKAGLNASADAATTSRLVVHLVPLGAIADGRVAEAAEGLRSHVFATVVVEPRAELAASIESTIRGRYRAERILDWMESIASAPGKWMAITDVDIVAKKGQNDNWGVLGLGAVDGRCSVLSTFRMERRWENGGAPEALVRERLWKTAVHELGHTLGLPHCPHRGCIMEDAHGTVKTTDRETDLCDDCARRFREAG